MSRRLLIYVLATISLFFATVSFWTSGFKTSAATVPTRPKLVIIIIIDQFRNDYLDRFRPYFVEGGFNRLLSGTRFANCRYDYAVTATGPGHATLLTGTYPNIHGIIENEWYDRSLKRPVNCVEDLNTKVVDSAHGPGEERGASPQYLLGSTLGDELRLASGFQSKVVSISLKDRGAILPGGHTANAAYWYQPRTGRFISSTYYMTALPQWVSEFNDGAPSKEYCGKAWSALPITPGAVEKTLGEIKVASSEACPNSRFLAWLNGTPFISELELKFAREAVRNEKLGQGTATDLLTVSLSANDFIGHAYGPYSPQVSDMTLRTDRYLAAFFAEIDRLVGLTNVWIVLSADHGVAPTPKTIREQRLGLGLFRPSSVREALAASLSGTFGPDNWIDAVDIPYVYLNQNALAKHKVSRESAESAAATAAATVPGIFASFTRTEILREGGSSPVFSRKVSNSFFSRRSGDVFLILDPFAVPSGGETETTHGSPWSYDASVPLIFWGSQFRSGTIDIPCQPIDLVPTLAAALGLNVPSGSTGTPLAVALANK